MKPCVSRGNRRTASTRSIQTRELAILALSLIVFLGGIILFPHALATHAPARGTPPEPATTSRQAGAGENLYGDLIASNEVEEPAAPMAAEDTQDAQAAAEAPVPESFTPASPPPQASGPEPVPEAYDEEVPAEAPAQPSASVQQGSVIRHTAYREEPVYRTVHHQASTPREVTIGGKTRIEWTSCPVCGGKHPSAYNERIVDHVNESYCSACGAKHAQAYDEVVYS